MAEAAPSPEPVTEETAPQPARRRLRLTLPGGLSARLLMVTALFVVVAGLLVLPPALAAFEERWLLDRVRAGELASLAAEVDPERGVTERLSQELLDGAGVISVAVQTEGVRRLVLAGPRYGDPPYLVDLRRRQFGSWLAAPFYTLFAGNGVVRAVAEPRFRQADFVEIVTPDRPLKAELVGYLARLLAGIAAASLLVGAVIYFSLNVFLVRPMQRITRAIERFRVAPEDPAARVSLSGRRDEIGRAEAELDRMQADLLAALNSRARLAALGEAVAKINHDLRNMLTSAQIASDRLAALDDPKVSRALPRLERALDRAVTLATDVMAYGRSEEPAAVAKPMPLRAAIEMAAEDGGLGSGVTLKTVIDPREQVLADGEQLHRILVNLMRNAREAIESTPDRNGRGTVFAELKRDASAETSIIRLTDDGPGLPARALEHLFRPFVGSSRRGGTGLGLAIARELAQGHGGDLALVETGAGGSVFELTLPGIPPQAPAKSSRRKPAAGAAEA